ncbi:unnamed protein product [Thelazia callipaeda]|uniref:ABC transporter permease n=1 Tax=Thelazia callipaeda TaxID=103827 RepID=A0A0N5CQL2_THECL|nr:unnamed protein product [Thelazia callipaeda]
MILVGSITVGVLLGIIGANIKTMFEIQMVSQEMKVLHMNILEALENLIKTEDSTVTVNSVDMTTQTYPVHQLIRELELNEIAISHTDA